MHTDTHVPTGAKRGDSIFRRRHTRNGGGQRSKQNKSVTETDRPMVSSSPFRCLRINESRALNSHVRIHNDTVLCLNSCDPFGRTCHVRNECDDRDRNRCEWKRKLLHSSFSHLQCPFCRCSRLFPIQYPQHSDSVFIGQVRRIYLWMSSEQ